MLHPNVRMDDGGTAPVSARLASSRIAGGRPPEYTPTLQDMEPVFDAITALLARCPDDDDAALRPLMRTLVTEARNAGVHAEILLRLLKEGWRSLPELRTSEERLKRADSLNRVVSLCIREFYHTDGGE